MKKLIVLLALIFTVGISSAQEIKKDCVFGAYALNITLDPDVTMNQWMDHYTNTYLPVFEKVFTGTKISMLKGYAGDHSMGYGIFLYCESVEVYDNYWTKKGELTELGLELWNKLEKENKALSKLGKASWDFTDWIVL